MTSPLEAATQSGRLVINIDLPNGDGGDAADDSALTAPSGPSPESQKQQQRPPQAPSSAKSEALAPKQLILFTASETIVGTRLAEIPTDHNFQQQTESDRSHLFKMPESAVSSQQKQQQQPHAAVRRGVRFDDFGDGGGCAVVNLSGFFASQAARSRPIFSPKFDHRRRDGRQPACRVGGGGSELLPQPREILSLASLDVVEVGRGGGRRAGGGAAHGRRKRKSAAAAASTSAQQLQLQQQAFGADSTRGPSPTSAASASHAYFSCSDIVKRRESPATSGQPLKLDIDLLEGQLRQQQPQTSARSCTLDGAPPGSNSHRRRQHQHQLSELFGRLRVSKPAESDASSSGSQAEATAAGGQQHQQLQPQQFRLAEPRLKLSHFSGSRNPNTFYFLNTRVHIHTP